MAHSDNQPNIDYTVIINSSYIQKDTSTLTKQELFDYYHHAIFDFQYRYKSYRLDVYWNSYSGMPNTEIYQNAINQINKDLGFVPEAGMSGYCDITSNVSCTRDYKIYDIDPMIYVAEIIGQGGFAHTYYVLHRLDSLNVPEILKEYGILGEKVDYESSYRNIKPLTDNYNKSIDIKEIAAYKINNLKNDMDSIIQSISYEYSKIFEEIRHSTFEYNIINYGDLIGINGTNGRLQLFESYGLVAPSKKLDDKLSVTCDFDEIHIGEKIIPSDLDNNLYYQVSKYCNKTGSRNHSYTELISTSLDIVSFGPAYKFRPEQIISIYENHKCVGNPSKLIEDSTPGPIRKMARKGSTSDKRSSISKLKMYKIKPTVQKQACDKSPTQITNELNKVMGEMVQKIELVTFGYHTLIEKITSDLIGSPEYQNGDLLLFKNNDMYSLRKFTGLSNQITNNLVNYSIGIDGYKSYSHPLTKECFNPSIKISTMELINSAGHINKKSTSYQTLVKNIVKKIGNISEYHILSDHDLNELMLTNTP